MLIKNLNVAHIRLNAVPGERNGKDGYLYKASVYAHANPEPVVLDFEISDTTAASLGLSDEARMVVVTDAIHNYIDANTDNLSPAFEQVKSWDQPIYLARDRFDLP